jgi:hypothetical protein
MGQKFKTATGKDNILIYYINILYLVHSDQNTVMITRAGQLRQTRNLAIKDDSEAMKVFISGKTGGRRNQCRP